MDIHFDAIQDIFPPNLNPVSKGQNKWFCPDCRKVMDGKMFFKTKRLDKFPNGYLPKCKNCITLKIDDTDPVTFLPILKEIDAPYVPSVWRSELKKKDAKAGSMLGKYVSQTYMNQYKTKRWIDSKDFVREEEEALLSTLKTDTMSHGDAIQELERLTDLKAIAPAAPMGAMVTGNQNIAALYGLTPETSKYNLTQEEIDQLRVTWGTDYTEEEYFKMESNYNQMCRDYVINDTIAIDNARIISKMTMKIHKFLDLDDIESATKMSRQRDLIVKSSNLAPQQQKDRGSSTYSISQLAYLIEKQGGFIPNYYETGPKDDIDALLVEMQKYTERLIHGEPQIEDLVRNHAEVLARHALPKEITDLKSAFDEFEDDVLGGDIDELPDSEDE